MAGLGGYQVAGKTDSSQTATIVVIKQSLGSWSHLWSLNNVSGCGSTSLFGSHAGTHQIRDQSRALEDRNDSNNSLEVLHLTPLFTSFTTVPYMDVVDMHNVIINPSDSVLLEKTMEASFLVDPSPVSLTLYLCLTSLFGMSSGNRQPLGILPIPVGCSQHISTVPTPRNGGNPGIKDLSSAPLSVTADRCEK